MKSLMVGLAMLGVTFAAMPAWAEGGTVQAGTLTCELTGKTNFILVSKRRFDCKFDPAGSKPNEKYKGVITNIGADLEVTKTEQIVWLVMAPSADVPSGGLAGNYGGAGASATVGVGLGARALIGGFKKSVALQPLSMSGSKGFGASAAIQGLKLTHVK